MKITAIFILIFTIAPLASCNRIEKRGYSFEVSDYQILKEKINSKGDTLNFAGCPSFVSEADNQELWVYYSEDIKKLLFFKPYILDRKIITINFDNKNVINKIKTYSLKNQNMVMFNPDYTKVESQKKSWLSQIFGNIGQVRAN